MTDETVRVSPFRRRRFVQRHRRVLSAVRWARLALGTLAVVGLPAVAVGWTTTTDAFELRQLDIAGSPRVPEAWLAERLESLEGRQLLVLSLSEVRERVEGHPWLANVELRKRLPDRLEVRVEERSPAALLRQGVALAYVDGRGEVIAPYEGGPAAPDLVLITARDPREVAATLEFLGELERAAPRWARALSEIEAVDQNDYRLFIEGLPFPVTVSAEGLARALADFQRWWPAIVDRHGTPRSVDLRLPGRIVMEPAVESAAEPVALARVATAHETR